VPARALRHRPRTLLKAMSAVVKIGSFAEPRCGVFASFVAVDLRGHDDITERHVFDAARDPDEQRHVRVEMTDCAIRYRGNPGVAGADFDDRDVPIVKRAVVENRALYDLLVPVAQ
jgi:hypothetical protein